MSKIALTLTANPQKAALPEALCAQVAQNLKQQGALILSEDWLAAGEAYDIIFSKFTPEHAEVLARQIVADAPIDIFAQEASSRKKRLLITDMDSTIITCECIDELADFAGLKPQVSAITERAMNGELDFADALNARVALLAGMPESTLQEVYDQRVRLMGGAKELVATMRSDGAQCVLVSGGFTFFTERVRMQAGFHRDYSNLLEIKNGQLTGKVTPPILDKHAKLKTLMEESAKLNIPAGEVLAVGDGANDLPMLLAAGLGVAYHAKPSVQAAARHRINHCDLTALLFAQGYGKEEVVSQ